MTLPGIGTVNPGSSSHSGLIVQTDHGSGTGAANATYSFGVPYPGRVMVAAISYNGATHISTVTIGGVSATKQKAHGESDADFGEQVNAEIWTATVPTGSTGNITATLSSGSYRGFGIAVYSIGTSSATPTSTISAGYAPLFNGDPIHLSGNLSPSVSNSMVIGVAGMARTGGTTSTWSHGPTEDLDYQYTSEMALTSASKMMVASGTYNVEVDMDQVFNLIVGTMVAASWSP